MWVQLGATAQDVAHGSLMVLALESLGSPASAAAVFHRPKSPKIWVHPTVCYQTRGEGVSPWTVVLGLGAPEGLSPFAHEAVAAPGKAAAIWEMNDDSGRSKSFLSQLQRVRSAMARVIILGQTHQLGLESRAPNQLGKARSWGSERANGSLHLNVAQQDPVPLGGSLPPSSPSPGGLLPADSLIS